MLHALLSGLVTGWAIAIPVGAVAVLVVTTSAQRSLAHGAVGALGVAAVDGAYAALAVTGGAAVARLIGPYAGALRIVAAAVLLVMAARMIMAAWSPSRDVAARAAEGGPGPKPGAGSPARTFWTFAAITAVNPATVIYFAAVVLGNRELVATTAQGVVFVAAAFVASASWQLTLALAGAGLGRMLTGPTGRRVTGLLAGILIAVLAVVALLG